ncbi:hypothetical protein ABK040_014316 [Willaertia magna]
MGIKQSSTTTATAAQQDHVNNNDNDSHGINNDINHEFNGNNVIELKEQLQQQPVEGLGTTTKEANVTVVENKTAVLSDAIPSTHNIETMDLLQLPKTLIYLERLKNLLDESITIPYIHYKIGLDPILGLIPVVGDAIPVVISLIMIGIMMKYGISKMILCKMLTNVLIDFLVGCIPLVGDLFDCSFKANKRNWELFMKYYKKKYSGGLNVPATAAAGQV